MDYAQLGRTGVYVSRIALGTLTFGGAGTQLGTALGGLDAAAADRIVSRALDGGVNLIDTADVYGGGTTEEVLGQVLGARRNDIVLATKFSARTGLGPNDSGASRLHVMRALDASLRRLRTDHVDLYQLHAFDPVTPIEETLAALDDAVRQGKVRYIGASNVAAWQLMRALGVSERRGLERFVASQSYLSLVGRDVERDLVPLAVEEGLSLLAWAPLAGGLLARAAADPSARRTREGYPDFPPTDRAAADIAVTVAAELAERRGATVAQVALAWVLSRPAVTSVIVGAKRVEQLDDNLGAVDLALSAEDLAALDAVAPPPALYPQWVWDFTGDHRTPPAARASRSSASATSMSLRRASPSST